MQMNKQQGTDESLLKGIARGRESCLEELMDKYIPYTQAIVGAIGGNNLSTADVEEVLSDVFFAVWQYRKQLRTAVDIKPYLAQIARNKTKNKLRSMAPNLKVVSTEQVEEDKLGNDAMVMMDQLITGEQMKNIDNCIEGFPYPENEILYAYYRKEWKLKEIAAWLGLPLATVKTKLYRARKKLKQQLVDGGIYGKASRRQ